MLPELAVLSAPAHSDGPHAEAVLTSVSAAIDTLPGETGALYYDYLTAQFYGAACKLLEEIVNVAGYEWKSEFAKTHRGEGRAEGEAKAVLLVLDARGFTVPNEIRERVTNCTDTDQLERWVQRAAVIAKAEDLLE